MSSSLAALCVPATFEGVSLWGAEITGVSAQVVTNFTQQIPTFIFSDPLQVASIEEFCNVTVWYKHPGQGDVQIGVESWLPTPEAWNGRFQAGGGGGYGAGRLDLTSMLFMTTALVDGFACSTTDAGLTTLDPVTATDISWALQSTGNVDEAALHRFGARGLQEQGLVGKAVTEAMYSKAPDYSYFRGCSTGGRQGLMVAQRFPDLYDGVIADAPAYDMPAIMANGMAPQQVMVNAGEYPFACEMDAITLAAVTACDKDDVQDGVLSSDEAQACLTKFDLLSLVGQTVVNCTDAPAGQEVTISATAAAVVNASWYGSDALRPNFGGIAIGVSPGADLTGNLYPPVGQINVAKTTCVDGTCTGNPHAFAVEWYRYLAARDASWEPATTTQAELDAMTRFSVDEYSSLIVARNPDLSQFKAAGGKMMTYHGVWDPLIPIAGSRHYYNAVLEKDSSAQDFYRYFEVPGLAHCWGGLGGKPNQMFSQLQDWVENGNAPASSPHEITVASTGEIHSRILCPYPEKPAFSKTCGDAGKAECWSCVGEKTNPVQDLIEKIGEFLGQLVCRLSREVQIDLGDLPVSNATAVNATALTPATTIARL